MGDSGLKWVPFNFLALPDEQSSLDRSRVVVLPVPYDSTASFKAGARDGPRAIIEASYNLEDYDPELDADVAQIGINTAPWLEPHMGGPHHMVERVREAVTPFLDQGKLVALIGGEHSISIGHVKALLERYPTLSVLYLDAHADLRDEYMSTGWGHASVARRIWEMCPLVLVGVRSLSAEESQFISEAGINTLSLEPSRESGMPTLINRLPALDGVGAQGRSWDARDVIGLLSGDVYISIDLDVLDPSIMSAVGTPEPGGMTWYQLTSLLRAVAEQKRIVGFDVTELSPGEGPTSCAYTAAKLVSKMVAYAILLPQRPRESKTTKRPMA